MPAFDTSTKTSELDAVNRILTAVGQAPLPTGTDLTAELDTDATMVVQMIRDNLREQLAVGWNFNYKRRALAPVGTLPGPPVLNIFQEPADVLRWDVAPVIEHPDIEVIPQMSVTYKVGGLSVPVLADRLRDKDGFEASKYPALYLECYLSVPWTLCPEEFRRFVMIRAGRQFAQGAIASTTLQGFAQEHELMAWRALKKFQLKKPRPNYLNNPTAREVMGGRSFFAGRGLQRGKIV